jgi:hypothetical protein
MFSDRVVIGDEQFYPRFSGFCFEEGNQLRIGGISKWGLEF